MALGDAVLFTKEQRWENVANNYFAIFLQNCCNIRIQSSWRWETGRWWRWSSSGRARRTRAPCRGRDTFSTHSSRSNSSLNSLPHHTNHFHTFTFTLSLSHFHTFIFTLSFSHYSHISYSLLSLHVHTLAQPGQLK